MKYLFIGGCADGTWREVETGTMLVNVTAPVRVVDAGERQPTTASVHQYAMQGWCPDRRGHPIHRIFAYRLPPDQVFLRLINNYHPHLPSTLKVLAPEVRAQLLQLLRESAGGPVALLHPGDHVDNAPSGG